MKQIIYQETDFVEFWVEIFSLNLDGDLTEQVENIINKPEHRNDLFITSSLDEALFLASKLIKRDDEYNYATITLYRYGFDEYKEEVCKEATIISELWSEEIKQELLN